LLPVIIIEIDRQGGTRAGRLQNSLWISGGRVFHDGFELAIQLIHAGGDRDARGRADTEITFHFNAH